MPLLRWVRAMGNFKLFSNYLKDICDFSQKRDHESFIAIQRLFADICNAYTNGELSNRQRDVLIGAANVVMNQTREELWKKGVLHS